MLVTCIRIGLQLTPLSNPFLWHCSAVWGLKPPQLAGAAENRLPGPETPSALNQVTGFLGLLLHQEF